MGLYVVSAVRLDTAGEVEYVQWASVDGMANEYDKKVNIVGIDRVIEAIDRGDRVEAVFPTIHGNVSGGYLVRKVLPGGFENIQEENPIENRMLKDMPTFDFPKDEAD